MICEYTNSCNVTKYKRPTIQCNYMFVNKVSHASRDRTSSGSARLDVVHVLAELEEGPIESL